MATNDQGGITSFGSDLDMLNIDGSNITTETIMDLIKKQTVNIILEFVEYLQIKSKLPKNAGRAFVNEKGITKMPPYLVEAFGFANSGCVFLREKDGVKIMTDRQFLEIIEKEVESKGEK